MTLILDGDQAMTSPSLTGPEHRQAAPHSPRPEFGRPVEAESGPFFDLGVDMMSADLS